jgi:hypothetical protein
VRCNRAESEAIFAEELERSRARPVIGEEEAASWECRECVQGKTAKFTDAGVRATCREAAGGGGVRRLD